MCAVRIPVGILWQHGKFAVEEQPDDAMAKGSFLPWRCRAANEILIAVAPDVRDKPAVWPNGDAEDYSIHRSLGLRSAEVLGERFDFAEVLRDQGVGKKEARLWIGYGSEEQKRWVRKMLSTDYKRGLVFLPLVEAVRLNRAECQSIIKSMGWPEAPKSRCWVCPNQNDLEWAELTPEELKMAGEFERKMQERDPNAWLHRSCQPIESVNFSKAEPDLFARPCESGACFT